MLSALEMMKIRLCGGIHLGCARHINWLRMVEIHCARRAHRRRDRVSEERVRAKRSIMIESFHWHRLTRCE